MFHMEVWGLADNVMYANRSRDVPSFWATNLPPGLKVYIRVFSSNTKGRSTPVLLHAETSIAAGVSCPSDLYLIFVTVLWVRSQRKQN